MRAGASVVVARRLRTDQNSSGGVLAAEARDVPGIARDDPLDEPRSAELPVACGPGRRWHAPEAPERTAAMNPGRRRTASSGGAPWFAGNARPADERVADMNPARRARGTRARRTPERGPPAREPPGQAGRTRNKLAGRRLGGAGPRPRGMRRFAGAAGPPPANAPGEAFPPPPRGAGGSLTMSCSRMGKPHTAIGDAPFHFRVRDGFGWVRRSMVVSQNRGRRARRARRPPTSCSQPGGASAPPPCVNRRQAGGPRLWRRDPLRNPGAPARGRCCYAAKPHGRLVRVS